MNQVTLTELVNAGKSIREIAAIAGKSPGSVRHWLRKYELSTYKEPKYKDNCKFCGVKLNDENTYASKKRWACKKCSNRYRGQQFVQTKLHLVELMGGKCQCCGFNQHYSALEFHHLDPKEKEFNLTITNYGWDKLVAEVSKCILLCANCHRMVHAGVIDCPMTQQVKGPALQADIDGSVTCIGHFSEKRE
jgi:hypothetical protein